jgi:DNA integrity scanning protein DisA with diadenylate cyclase activity
MDKIIGILGVIMFTGIISIIPLVILNDYFNLEMIISGCAAMIFVCMILMALIGLIKEMKGGRT